MFVVWSNHLVDSYLVLQVGNLIQTLLQDSNNNKRDDLQ